MRSTANISAVDQTIPIKTKLYRNEFEYLLVLYKDPLNTEPRFAFPDLISACVSIVFAQSRPCERLIDYVRSHYVLRAGARRNDSRTEGVWSEQYELLRAVQTSPGNRYPNPQFSLGDFTSACVGIVAGESDPIRRILEQARINYARRFSAAELVDTPRRGC